MIDNVILNRIARALEKIAKNTKPNSKQLEIGNIDGLGYHLTDKQKEDFDKQGYSYEIDEHYVGEGFKINLLTPKDQEKMDTKEHQDCENNKNDSSLLKRCLDELAEQDKIKNKEKHEQKELETKMLIGEFIGSCKQYFVDIHIHRFVLPNDYERVDHMIQNLLELYEKKLPYLTRNPDVEFKLIYLSLTKSVQLEINRNIKKILDIKINPYQTELNKINKFLDCITASWRDFKKEHQAEQEQQMPNIDCPMGRNGYQCVKTAASCLDKNCPNYRTNRQIHDMIHDKK